MTTSELIEMARDNGIFTTLSVDVTATGDNIVDGIDWDAYPHVSELA